MSGHQDHPLPPISRQNVARSGCKGLTAAVVAPSPQKPLRADGRRKIYNKIVLFTAFIIQNITQIVNVYFDC